MTIKIFNSLLIVSASSVLLSGCVNQNTLSDPSVQKGAAIGAVTGAVIGGNVGDKSGTNIATGAVLGAIAGGALGQAVDDQSTQPQESGGWQ